MDIPIGPHSLVLIGIVSDPKDLEIARLFGWYRIPFRFAPKIVDVDYLALYQTAAFGKDHRWQIEYYAQVQGHELTTRDELLRDEPDHPHAKDEYYKIQLGPLQKLPVPITAEKWKRLTFLYSTGERLLAARQLNDLRVDDEERVLLWKALREKTRNPVSYATNDINANLIIPELIPFLDGLVNKENKEILDW